MSDEIEMPSVTWELVADQMEAWVKVNVAHYAQLRIGTLWFKYAWIVGIAPNLHDPESYSGEMRAGFADSLAEAQAACLKALREVIEAVGFTIEGAKP